MMEKKATYKPPYTVSGKAMTLMTEIAAAIERYRIEMEGPNGVRLRKLNHIRTIRGTTAIEGNTLTEDQITALLAGKRVSGSAREIAENKARHLPKGTKSDQKCKPKSDQKKGARSDQKIWEAMKERPGITIAELMQALGMSESGVKKVIRKLKDANLIRRTGPDKGGRWEIC